MSLTRLRWWWFRFGEYPVRSREGAWNWHIRPYRLTWWVLVPRFAQRAFVARMNARFCARRGHDDTLWHMAEDDLIAKPARCSNCSTELSTCTGYGHMHLPESAS